MESTPDVLIVGAGLAGLTCAHRLHEKGVSYQLLEASAGVGGRVVTDTHEGFLLDRGFQVFQTAYPEAQRLLDYDALDLQRFQPGALVRVDGRFHTLADPWRRPSAAVSTLLSPVATFMDKLRLAQLRGRVRKGGVEDLFRKPQTTTLTALKEAGFSSTIIERFFRPFLGGIFLERDLRTSSRVFEFVFRMFSQGDACLPAGGMGAIPQQLAERLPADTICTHTRVTQLQPPTGVTLENGEQRQARAVVIAVEGPAAAQLLGEIADPGSRRVYCLYFAAERPPVSDPVLVLNGEGKGPINNLSVPSVVAPSYAPAGAALISVAVLDDPHLEANTLETEVRSQLAEWFGPVVESWRHLRTYHITHAQPELVVDKPTAEYPLPVKVRAGLYVCGDHRDHASIQGAMESGRRTADAVLEDLR